LIFWKIQEKGKGAKIVLGQRTKDLKHELSYGKDFRKGK